MSWCNASSHATTQYRHNQLFLGKYQFTAIAVTPFKSPRALSVVPEFSASMAMFTSHFKKRSIHITNQKVMESFKSDSESRSRTVVWEEAPEWQQDNEYILTGYRPGNTSYSSCFKSLSNAHNETCNIYTHLIGALILPLVAINTFRALSKPRFPHVSGMDYVTLGIFFFSAECCLVFSTAFHLVGCHSRTVEQFWLRMDLLGIVAVTIGTSVPGIYYVFACEPSLQRLHWSVVRCARGR
jgi:adiponectin receptor